MAFAVFTLMNKCYSVQIVLQNLDLSCLTMWFLFSGQHVLRWSSHLPLEGTCSPGPCYHTLAQLFHCGLDIAELVFGARAPTSSLSSALGLPSNGHPSRFPDQLRLEAHGLLLTLLRRGQSRVTSPEAAIRVLKNGGWERVSCTRSFQQMLHREIALQAAMCAVYSRLGIWPLS